MCLTGPELNYSPTDGELLAVVWAVKLFRPYVWGTHFSIVTDHKALQWLQTTKNLTGKLARYAITLQEYDFTVVHRSGAQHGNVDSLSRIKHLPEPHSSRLDLPQALMAIATSTEEDTTLEDDTPTPKQGTATLSPAQRDE